MLVVGEKFFLLSKLHCVQLIVLFLVIKLHCVQLIVLFLVIKLHCVQLVIIGDRRKLNIFLNLLFLKLALITHPPPQPIFSNCLTFNVISYIIIVLVLRTPHSTPPYKPLYTHSPFVVVLKYAKYKPDH